MMGSFRIKVDFSEVTDSFWKEAWYFVKDTEKIKDFWERCRQEFSEEISDHNGLGHNFGLFLNDRYLFPSLPTIVLKEDDTVCVRLLNVSRPLGDKRQVRLNTEAMFQSGLFQQDPTLRSDANIASETFGKTKQVLEASQVLDVSFQDPTAILSPDAFASTKKRRKRNVCDTIQAIPAEKMAVDTILENVSEKTKKKKKKGAEDAELQSFEARSNTVNSEAFAEDISVTQNPDKHKKKKGNIAATEANTTDTCLVDFETQDNSCSIEEAAEPQESNAEEPSFSEAEQYPVQSKRRRTRRRKPKVVAAVPEPVPQVGSFKGDSFYKPPLSKRLYSLECKSNTIIRFDESGNGNNDLESSNQATAQEAENVHLPDPVQSKEYRINPFNPLTDHSTPKVKAQTTDPGLSNLLALTQTPVVSNRDVSTPSAQVKHEPEPMNHDLPIQQDELRLPVASQRLCTATFSKNPTTAPDPDLASLFALTQSPVVFNRSVSVVSTSSKSQPEPVKEELAVNQGAFLQPARSQRLRDASFHKNPPEASDWDIQNYEQYPLISEPRVNEIIAFKELELSASYEPVMSNYKVAQIVNICTLTKKVVLEILAGETKIVRSGRFEIEEEEAECIDLENEESKNQRECCWKDLKETRLIYP